MARAISNRQRVTDNFRKACYYAVREDFNAQNDADWIDRKFDALIRFGIRFFERVPKKKLPPIAPIEITALAGAAYRRGIHPNQRA